MQEMDEGEIQAAIAEARVGILGLARENRSYAIPIFFAYEDGAFYWHSQPGEKDRYVHDTEEACLTLVHGYGEDEWKSVMAFGKPEAIWDEQDLDAVEAILDDVPPPPEMGEDEAGEPKRSDQYAVYWTLVPDRVTGRKSEAG